MPWDFWNLTPREVVLQSRGYHWREEQENWRMAAIVATLMNPILTLQADPKKARRNRKRVTPADVLGKKPEKGPGARTPEEQLSVFKRLARGLGGTVRESSPNSDDSSRLPLHHGHKNHQD